MGWFNNFLKSLRDSDDDFEVDLDDEYEEEYDEYDEANADEYDEIGVDEDMENLYAFCAGDDLPYPDNDD